MASTSKKSPKTEILVALIGTATALSTAAIANWDKIFPNNPSSVVTNAYAGSGTSNNSPQTRSAGGSPALLQQSEVSGRDERMYRADWAYRYFKPSKAGTFNVIVKSLEGDAYAGVTALRTLGAQFPDVAFRLVNTVALDGVSNQRFAVFAGNGLSRSEAKKLVSMVKQKGVANDAYMVVQKWDADDAGPADWEILR